MEKIESYVNSLKKNGYVILDEKVEITDSMLNYYYSAINGDIFPGKVRRWCDDNSSDRRVFVSLEACEEIYKPISDVVEKIFNLYVGDNEPAFYLINSVEKSGSKYGSGGCWHRDSYSKQVKMFIFLGDIEYNSGPLAYWPGSHGLLSKLFLFLFGKYKRRTRFEGKIISRIIRWFSKEVVGEKGTVVLADVSGLHTGLPALKSGRFMLTQYRYAARDVEKMQKRFLG